MPPKGKEKKKEEEKEKEQEEGDQQPATKKARVDAKNPRRPDYGETLFSCEYAASERSTCKTTGKKIPQGSVRLGTTIPGPGDYDLTSWHQFDEYKYPLVVSEEETLTSASQIFGYDRLEKSDQGALDKWFEKVSKLPKKEKVEVDDAADGATRPPLQGTLFASAFKERDEVQALGAKWDQRANSFYVPFGSDATPFAKWLGAGADASGAIAAHNAVPRVAAVGIVRNPSLGEAKDAKVQAERPSIEPEAVAQMSASALKEELSARGLDASGKKADLVAKLQAALDPGAAAAGGGSGGAVPANEEGRKVDPLVPDASEYVVHKDYDIKLTKADLTTNVNSFYFIQVLQKRGGGFASYWCKTGAIKMFEAKFNEKTRGSKDKSPAGEAWAEFKAGNFMPREGYYSVVDVEVGVEAADGQGSAIGKLTAAQIEKGMAVLVQLKALLESDESSLAGKAEVEQLSTAYYKAIPTSVGRKAPPPLDTLELVGEKEHLLGFWLKMGFEDTAGLAANPIKGIWEQALPSTLRDACLPYGVSDEANVRSSVDRGKTLAAKKAGGPVQPMDGDKYGSIVLYTGNSCYRELNQALRLEHSKVPKFIPYLRLLFEAMDCMPKRKVTLWRGIAADLYDEYEPGKVITWWSVSSTTADEKVARSFMSQLGGVASLITLQTKSALNITPLSVYPQEKESLLAPGTNLKGGSGANEEECKKESEKKQGKKKADVPVVAATPATPADAKESVETAHIEPEAVGKMTVECLKKELLLRGLDASGKKAELVAKLKAVLEAPLAAKKESGKGDGKQKADDVCHDEAPARKKAKVELASDNLPDFNTGGIGEYSLEYAKSDKSTCCTTGENIPYGSVRLGVATRAHDGGDWVKTMWHKFESFPHTLAFYENADCDDPTFKEHYTSASQIAGYQKLKPNDRAAVDEWFAKVNKDYLLEDAVHAGGSAAGGAKKKGGAAAGKKKK